MHEPIACGFYEKTTSNGKKVFDDSYKNAIALIISHFSKGYKLPHSQLTTAFALDNLAQYAPPYAKMRH
jgi:hypothetical protein